MYNNTLITERMGIITSAVNRLNSLTKIPLEQFREDENAIDIAENRLRKALEALFDLGRHIAIKSGVGVPSDYRSVIEKLMEINCLPCEFAQRITGMAGYRNRLIHDYNKVTPDEIYEIMQSRMSDLMLFCNYIIEYLKKQNELVK